MIKRNIITLSLAGLLLLACQDKEIITDVNINPEIERPQTGKNIDENLPSVDVRATTHLFPKETIIAATVAPKTGMRTFSSQILLLSESGKVYSTTTAFPRLELIHEGPFDELSGFYLLDGRSGFLAKSGDNIEAFLDGDPAGFKKVEFETSKSVLDFCQASLALPGQTVMKSDEGNMVYFLSQNAGDEDERLYMEDNGSAGKNNACGQGSEFLLPAFTVASASMDEKTADQIREQITSGEIVSTEITSQGLVLSLEDKGLSVNVVDGLSIDGISTPEWVFTTSQPLGNTFNNGVTLIRGDGNNRIVMIANDYLGKTVFGEKIDSGQ